MRATLTCITETAADLVQMEPLQPHPGIHTPIRDEDVLPAEMARQVDDAGLSQPISQGEGVGEDVRQEITGSRANGLSISGQIRRQ